MFHSFLYLEIEVFAALVLLVIMDREKNSMMTMTQRLFKAELLTVVAILLLDAGSWLLDGVAFPGAWILHFLFNYVYWQAILFPSFIGMLYCFSVLFGRLDRKWVFMGALPILFGIVLLVANFWTGWIFTVSKANVYARGPYFMVVGMVPFLHMAVAIIVTLGKSLRAQAYERKKYLILTLFMVIPLVGAVLQVCIYGLVTTWVGLTLSLLMCYVYVQNGNLATDPLTGLNNRGRFDTYSAWLWENRDEGTTLYLIVFDIDKFKSINDTYGHTEGDLALVTVAGVLKTAMADQNGFLARIGGDEFAILLRNKSEAAVQRLIRRIRENLHRQNRTSGKPYWLSLSLGYAGTEGFHDEDFLTIYARADQAMYRDKNRR